MEHSVPKRRHIKFRRRGITLKKAFSLMNCLFHYVAHLSMRLSRYRFWHNPFFFAALPWLSGSAAGLSSRSLEFNPEQFTYDLWRTMWHWLSFSKYFSLPLSLPSYQCCLSIHRSAKLNRGTDKSLAGPGREQAAPVKSVMGTGGGRCECGNEPPSSIKCGECSLFPSWSG